MATALHSARTRFFDKCGKPLCGGTVHTYQVGSTTAKPTYTDVSKTAMNTNPVILDSIGSAAIFLDGAYRVRVLDRNGVLVEDIAFIESWISATEKTKIYESINNHVSNAENPHNVTKTQIGLNNVDNTSDINKPVSAATAQAIIEATQNKANKSTSLSGYGITDAYTKTEADNKISALSATTYAGHKGYLTLAAAQAAQATLAANTLVEVTNDSDVSKNGLYLWDGTTLTKSAYDPLTLSKAYTDSQKSDTLNQMQEAIDGIDKSIMVSDIKGEVDVTGEVVYGEYYTSSGATAAYANTIRTAKIKLDSITDIWVTRNIAGLGGLHTVFFDSNNAFLSTHAVFPNDTPTKLTIPVGAAYVGVSASSLYPLSVVKKSSVDGVTIAGMQGRIDSLEDGFGSISGAVKETAIPFDNNGYYWNPTTGLLTASSPFKASAKTLIPSNSLLVINGNFDYDRAGGQVLFFDSNGALVSSNFVRKLSYDNYLLAPPVTATHVAISTAATLNTSVTLKGGILIGFSDINSTYTDVKSGVNSNAKTVRANNFYDLGNNYAAIKSQRARSNYGILFAGQSNMVGHAAYDSLATLGLPSSLAINNWTGAAFTAPQTVASGTKWGIWWSLLKRLKDYKPTTDIYSYISATGGSTMHTDWNPAKQGALFDSFLVNIDRIKKLDLVNLKACVWWQGESDSASPHAENYEQRLKDFINAVRGAANDPLLPFVVLGIHKNTGSWYSPVVRAAQIRASIDMPNVYFVDVDDVPYTTAVGQGGHYDGVFFEAVAPRVFDIIKDL